MRGELKEGMRPSDQPPPETGKVLLDDNFKPSDEVDVTIITELKLGRDGVVVKLADKMKAIDFLAKYFDMVRDHFKRQLEQEKLKIAHACKSIWK